MNIYLLKKYQKVESPFTSPTGKVDGFQEDMRGLCVESLCDLQAL